MHPQVIGPSYRLELLESMLGFLKEHEDTWIATCRQIADRVT